MKSSNLIFLLAIALALTLSFVSAVTVNTVDTDTFTPGSAGVIEIDLENYLDDDAEDISLTLNYANTPFTPVGSSEQSIDQIDSDDNEKFTYRSQASTTAKAGEYSIPYTLQYTINSQQKTKTGTIGLIIKAQPDLTFSATASNAVVGQQGKINLKIVNKGFYDARFLSVRIMPQGFTLLSDDQEYIGSVNSDDFETSTYDVIFNSKNADLVAIVEYKDFDNKLIIKNVNLPLKVYSTEEAKNLGITKPNYTIYYVFAVVLIIVVWLIVRAVRKRRRLKRSMQNNVRR
jgi:hypothetical protein